MQCTLALFSPIGMVDLVSEPLLQAAANKLPAARAMIVPVRTGFFISLSSEWREVSLATVQRAPPLRSLNGEVTRPPAACALSRPNHFGGRVVIALRIAAFGAVSSSSTCPPPTLTPRLR